MPNPAEILALKENQIESPLFTCAFVKNQIFESKIIIHHGKYGSNEPAWLVTHHRRSDQHFDKAAHTQPTDGMNCQKSKHISFANIEFK